MMEMLFSQHDSFKFVISFFDFKARTYSCKICIV